MGNNYRADPGTSNKISDITCLPKETNIFKITSIKTVGCSGKKNVFSLYGEWEDETNLPTLDFDTEFYLSNENKDLIKCDYDITEKYMMCEFQGNGKIKINEPYIPGLILLYKITQFDDGTTVGTCDSGTVIYNMLTAIVLILLLL